METVAVSVTMSKSVEKLHHQILLRALLRDRMREMHREPKVPEAVPLEECFDCPARITSKELATIHSCEKWHHPECLFYKSENGCRFWEKCSYAHRQVDERPSTRSKKNDDKSAVAMLKKNDWHENVWQPVVNRDKSHERSGRPDINRDTCHELKRGPTGRRSSNARQLGCVFQHMKPPKSILRKSSDIRKPIQRVKFTEAVVRHADIRDQHPSLGMICPGEPHQRNPNVPKFEDRSQEETEWQERCAREAAWRLAKCILKLNEKNKAAFFSPSENWCLLAPSTPKPEEREFVVDSGASMHMICKKDLNSAEMDTLTKSCSPTTVITANGEVQTHEEATLHVKELDILLTMKVFEDTPAVLSMNTDTLSSGSTVKNHISLKTVFGYNATRRTSFRSWFLVCHRVLPPTFLLQHQ